MLATASLSGVLGLWDLSSYRLRQQCKHPVSIVFFSLKNINPYCLSSTKIVKWHNSTAARKKKKVSKK